MTGGAAAGCPLRALRGLVPGPRQAEAQLMAGRALPQDHTRKPGVLTAQAAQLSQLSQRWWAYKPCWCLKVLTLGNKGVATT